MLLVEAERLALQLMDDYDLIYEGWVFQFDRSLSRFGVCKHYSRVISLSRHLVARNSEAEVRDVILHEIAHALCGPGVGHNWEWKEQCKAIGAKPERCYDSQTVDTPEHRWLGVCTNDACRMTYPRHRRRGQVCGVCTASIEWHEQQPQRNLVQFVDELPPV